MVLERKIKNVDYDMFVGRVIYPNGNERAVLVELATGRHIREWDNSFNNYLFIVESVINSQKSGKRVLATWSPGDSERDGERLHYVPFGAAYRCWLRDLYKDKQDGLVNPFSDYGK